MLMMATKHAYPITSTRASDNSSAQRSESASIAANSSLVTFFIRIRLEWNVKRSSGRIVSRPLKMAEISLSIVVFELGTICPIRYTRPLIRSPDTRRFALLIRRGCRITDLYVDSQAWRA